MALVVTMMAMVVLLALTGALVPLASTETAIGANHRLAIQALYAAEAALEWAVHELRAAPDWDAVLAVTGRSPLAPSTRRVTLADGTVLDLRDATRRLERAGAGMASAGRGLRWTLYAQGPLAALVPVDPTNGLLIVAVWIGDSPIESDGDPLRDANDTLVVHAAVFGPMLTHRAVQATIRRRDPPRLAPPRPWS